MNPARRYCSVTLACALFGHAAVAAAQAPVKAAPLPLKNVRLYEAGVAYFERSGKIGKASDLALPVPPSHLDDALKTLVVLGTDGKTSVAGVEFGSSMSSEMGRALAGLPDGESLTYPKLLRSLKGAAVELRVARGSERGRLVDVLDPTETDLGECAATPEAGKAPPPGASAACTRVSEVTLLVLTTGGEIRRLRSSEVLGVKPTDPAIAARLGAGLDAVSQQGAQAPKNLRVLAQSTGEVTLGYIAETPVWRSTYRMVLDPSADKATLQGWALVHNDTDEDWRKVRIELVNGRPDSFLFPLAAPRYARRELVTPAEPLSTVPQLFGKTADGIADRAARGEMWGDEIGDSFGAGGLGLTGVGEGGGGRGEGIGLGSIGTATGASTVLSIGDLAGVAQADGVEAGALFRYSLPSPVDLRAHGSALVPFLQQTVGARRIAFFVKPGAVARSAARIKNDTPQTLPAGTISFFADGGFAGESRLDRMKSGEARFVGFGTDLDVELTAGDDATRDEPQLAVFEKDTLVEHFVRHHRAPYDLVNRSGAARTAVLALGFVRNATVKGADELDFDTASGKALAIFQIDAKKQATRTLDVDEGLSRKHAFASLTPEWLRTTATSPRLPQAQKAALLEAAAALLEARTRGAQIPKRQADATEVEGDLTRLRGHVAALRSGGDVDDLVERLLQKEDQLKALRAQVKQLGVDVAAQTARARGALAKLKPAGR